MIQDVIEDNCDIKDYCIVDNCDNNFNYLNEKTKTIIVTSMSQLILILISNSYLNIPIITAPIVSKIITRFYPNIYSIVGGNIDSLVYIITHNINLKLKKYKTIKNIVTNIDRSIK